jgi:uncharacterized membrane protein YdjX (TVP38/TMEM64 family)
VAAPVRPTKTKNPSRTRSDASVILRFLARHPPPRQLVLLLAAAPPALLAAAALFFLAPSGAASASEGAVALSGAGLELFEAFLDQVTALGIWGPVAFIATVMLCEMVPLFPTQPLALSSGLLFGAKWGAVYQLVAVTLAASNAFLVARTVGRSLAERVIREELGHGAAAASLSSLASTDGEEEAAAAAAAAGEGSNNAPAPAPAPAPTNGLARATRAIEEGGPFKQFTAVLLLRLTPVVPYSASNYLLGLTPLGTLPYLAGTVVGMLPWTVLYAGVGGASRRLLQRGVSIDLLMQDLSERAARVSGDAAGVVAALVAAAAAAYALSQAIGRGQQQQQQQQQGPAAAVTAGAAAAAAEGGGGGSSGGKAAASAAAAAAAGAPETAAAAAETNRR